MVSARLFRVLSATLGIAALCAVAWYTYSAFSSGLSLHDVKVHWLVTAFALHLVLIAALPFMWIQLLRLVRVEDDQGVRATDIALIRSYGRSWLARYIPGRVWMFGGRILYGRQTGISVRAIGASTAVEAALSYSALGLLGVAFLAGAWIHWAMTLILTSAAFLATVVVARLVFSGHPSTTQRSRIHRRLLAVRAWLAGDRTASMPRILVVVLLYWLHAGAQLGFFVIAALSVGGLDSGQFLLLAGAWGVGASIGYISFFSAGGLGIRDGIAFGLVGSALAAPIAGAIVAISRVILVVADLAFVASIELASLLVGRFGLQTTRSHSLPLPSRSTGHGEMATPNAREHQRRVLVMASTFPRWEGDTVPPFVFQLSERLADLGYEMHVLAPHHRGAAFAESFGPLNVHRFRYAPSRLEALAYGGGILENLRRQPLNWALVPPFLAAQVLATWRLNLRYRFDLIHVHWLIPQGLSSALLPPWPATPKLLTAHGGDVFASRGSFRKKIVRFVAARHDSITVNSSAMRNAVAELTSRPATVIPMGFNVDQFSRNGAPDRARGDRPPRILFVGRLAEKKGVEYLIRAMPAIRLAFPAATLTIVGDGQRLNLLRSEAASLGVTDAVQFVGARPNSELPSFYGQADVFVAPSVVAADGDTEALGVVLLEAAGCELPIVATNVGGIPDVVRDGETGILVQQKSPGEIAAAVTALLGDPAKARVLGISARRLVEERFNWDNVAQRFAALYEGVASVLPPVGYPEPDVPERSPDL